MAEGPSKVTVMWGNLPVHRPRNESPQNGMQSIVIENSPVKTDTNVQLIGD
jgi:hypothetical protein